MTRQRLERWIVPAATVMLLACEHSTVAPPDVLDLVAAARAELASRAGVSGFMGAVAGTTDSDPVTRKVPLEDPQLAWATLGTGGGQISGGGVTLSVPAGALSELTTIVLYAAEGGAVEVSFWPSGLKLAVAADLSFELTATDAETDQYLTTHLEVVHWVYDSQGQLVGVEILPVTVSADGKKANLKIITFSAYTLAGG